jgi:DNA polymerase
MHGGILTENEVQASCRDLLKDAWLACARAGYRPILSVHDELVFDLPEATVAEAVPVIERLMTQSSPWAEGLPLAVETVVSDTYTK